MRQKDRMNENLEQQSVDETTSAPQAEEAADTKPESGKKGKDAPLTAQEEIVDSFSLFDDWTDRYQYIIDLGKGLEDLPAAQKIEDNRLKGCQSQVWIVTEVRDERLYFKAISDSSIVSGLIALMLKVYSGRKPADIIASPPDFIAEIELDDHCNSHQARHPDSARIGGPGHWY